jgi:polyphosphate kinase 2
MNQEMKLILSHYEDLSDKYEILSKSFARLEDEFEHYKEKNLPLIQASIQKELLKPYQVELLKLQKHLEKTNKKMIILFEGRDAAGKGGTIRKVTRYMNEKHYRVVALGKPTDVQKSQWFFQKYAEHFPRAGEIVLFDRSWYNRAMVEPVFGFCSPKEYNTFISDVVSFEKSLVKEGIILIKIYFSVSKKTQAQRFDSRVDDPLKQWKFSEVDMQAQELWDEFTQMKFKMLKRTHTNDTPWSIIKSDDKFLARVESMKLILNSVRYRGRDKKLDFNHDSSIFRTGIQEYRDMEEEMKKFGNIKG